MVIGGTGLQGRVICEHLLKKGKWKVRALARNKHTEKAQHLHKLGVEILEGDVFSKDALQDAMKDCYAVVTVLNPVIIGIQKEAVAGKLIADIAKHCGVQHYIYSSVGEAGSRTGVPHFDSKHETEQHVMNLGLKNYSIIRPVFFMENLLRPESKQNLAKGVLNLPLPSHQKLQMVAVDDIGGFIALMLNKPEEFSGKAIELAGDEQTMQEYANILGVKYEEVPLEKIESKDMVAMYEFFKTKGFHADIPHLKKLYPELTEFKTWAHKVGLAKER